MKLISKNNKLKLALLLIIIPFTSGCAIQFQNSGGNSLGGIFKSTDAGDNWTTSNSIPTTSGTPQSIGRLDTKFLILDPSDSKALYFSSLENGMFYTYDSAKNWQFATGLGKTTVNALSVDPLSKCTMYVSSKNSIFKSTDCTRSWSQIYHDDNAETTISSILVNHYNSNIIYFGTSRGELVISDDAGASWRVLYRFNEKIYKIIASPFDSRAMLVSLGGRGAFRSSNGGEIWEDLSEQLKVLKTNYSIRDMLFSKSNEGMVLLATDYGLLKSYDNGTTWGVLNLITPKKGATINSIGLGTKNPELIYYTTHTTFYRSTDGGEKWVTKQLPTSRAGWRLIINPKDDNIIYLGVRELEN